MLQAPPAFVLLFIPPITPVLPQNNADTNAQMKLQLVGPYQTDQY